MTPVAWALVAVSTLLALVVWSRVVMVALEIRAGGAPAATEQRKW
jgi:hypothetical protein